MLRQAITILLQKHRFLTTAEIAKALKKDKGRMYGYLEAMVDYGELSVKKVGNSKAYYTNDSVEEK